jgi:hypothetical protein
MTVERPGGRRRWLVLVVAGVVLLVLAAAAVRSLVLRDDTRALTTDEAVERYRTEISHDAAAATAPNTSKVGTTSAPRAAPPTSTAAMNPPSTVPAMIEPAALVDLGVYRYTTTGHEQVDALGGTSHPYPAETTITVTPGSCGVSLRWTALEERFDEWQLCATPDGIVLQSHGTQYHEFFGQSEDEAVSCDTTVVLIPTTPGDGRLVQQSCTLADDSWLPTWQVLESTHRMVDGHDVEVQHVRMTIDDDDEYWEHTTTDWFLAANGLPVAVTASKSSLSPSPIGPVQYDEQYQLTIISLTPLQ